MSTSSGPMAGYLLTKLAKVMEVRFADAIQQLGIRPRHYAVLVAVATMPQSSQQRLGQALGVAPSAVVAALDELQDMGAVVRRPVPNDRRQFAVELTDSGHVLLAQANSLAAVVDADVLAALTTAEKSALARTLAKAFAHHATPG